MCCRWPLSSSTWSEQTSECLWIWSQSRIKACLHTQCYLLNQPGNWDEGPWLSSSLPDAVLHEWCLHWWSSKASGTHTQWDHTYNTVGKPFWCHPPNYYSFKLVTLKWEYPLEKSMRTRISSRWNSQQKLHCGAHLVLNIVTKNEVSLTTVDGLPAPTLQQGDNYLSTLSHCMHMMLQMLWTTTTMPQCWKVLSVSQHHE